MTKKSESHQMRFENVPVSRVSRIFFVLSTAPFPEEPGAPASRHACSMHAVAAAFLAAPVSWAHNRMRMRKKLFSEEGTITGGPPLMLWDMVSSFSSDLIYPGPADNSDSDCGFCKRLWILMLGTAYGPRNARNH